MSLSDMWLDFYFVDACVRCVINSAYLFLDGFARTQILV